MYGSPGAFRPRGGGGRGRVDGGRGRVDGGPSHRPPRNFTLVNPNPHPPPVISLHVVEQALAKARHDLAAAGDTISSWKLSHLAALSLSAGSWSALGLAFHDVPSLRALQAVEGKVNAFIHCFVAVQKMTTVHDLGVEICRSEGVDQFEELGLGPLLRHPLIAHYFSVPPNGREVCKITVQDIISRLSAFLYKSKNREVNIDEFLEFLVKRYSVSSKEDLGVRVQSLGLHIKFIKGSRRMEATALRMVQEKGAPPEGHEYDDEGEDAHANADANAKSNESSSSYTRKDKKQDVCSATIVDEMKSIGIKLAIFNNTTELKQGEKPYDIGHIDPLKVGKIELSTKDVENFMAAWKGPCQKHSVAEVLAMMLHIYIPDKTRMRKGALCLKPDKKKTKMQTLFLSYPAVGLLNVAVRFIKYGKLESLEWNTDKQASRTQSSTSCTQMVVSESSAKQVPVSSDDASITRVENSVSFDDIIKQVVKYFDLDHLVPGNIDLPLERRLVFRDCEKWMREHFSVKDFESLGFGNFFEFLERHSSLLPQEVLYLLSENFCHNSCLSVSMLDRQLFFLLSQAEKNLGDTIFQTKKFISVLLKKQFPAISFQLLGGGQEKNFLNSIKSHSEIVSSVLFSAALLEYSANSLPLFENFPEKDSRIICGTGKPTRASESGSPDVAIRCLLKAPMLSDLHLWSHWDLVFAHSLGPLLEWLLNVGYIKELTCIITCDGRIIRIDHSATFDEFLEAAIRGSPFKVAVKLISLFCLYGGSKTAPLSLFRQYCWRAIDAIVKNYLDQMGAHSTESSRLCEDLHHIDEAYGATSQFILDCLGYLPSEFRSFAADVLVSGLQYFTKDTASIILRQCETIDQRIMLHDIGLSLGVVEWINDYHTFSSSTNVDLFVSSETSSGNSETNSPNNVNLKKTIGTKNDFFTDFKVGATLEEDSNLSEEHKKTDKEVNEISRTGITSGEFEDDLVSGAHTQGNVQDASLLIQAIRHEEFGLDSDLDNAESNLLRKQHARLGRALQCLSQELYSQDSHFLLELVQNADDNKYAENVEPTLVFVLQDSGIIVLNNEHGFSAENIRALCDVGNSTKKGSRAGYIGQKGIGFKSVFRVTDAPEIHSNGFHVKFDITQGQIGFVLPTIVPAYDINSLEKQVVSDFDQTNTTSWNTCIVLPFSSTFKEGKSMVPIMSMFLDLHPSLLLFLHRLECIKFKNMIDDKFIIMKKEILGDNMVRVSHGKEKMSWLVASETLQVPDIRSNVEITKISVAFTLQESDNHEYKPHLDQQPVFAFLPLRKYGLKFILQGDFVLPSSREEVDANNGWNQWLLSKFPDLFVSSEKLFTALPCFQNDIGKAVTTFMSFVPLSGEVHGFFSNLPRLIISKLRLSDCLLLDGPKLEWVPPCKVLRSWDNQARNFLPESLLQKHLGLGYLSNDIILPDSLAKSLGVQEYGPKILVEILSSVCRSNGTISSLGLDWISNWLNAFFRALSVCFSVFVLSTNVVTETELISTLREIPFIPLSDGTYCSMTKGPIWLPYDTSILRVEGHIVVDHFYGLYSKLRTVSPLLFSAAAGSICGWEGNSVDSLVKVLNKIGIRHLSGHDIIKDHILPSMSDKRCICEDTNLAIEYLSFIVVHFQSICTHCHSERDDIISQLREKSIILTNNGYKCTNQEPVHFGKEFGNLVDVRPLIDDTDIKWNEVDTSYLKHPSTQLLSFGMTNWREFFLQLGVSDFVQVLHIKTNAADVLGTADNSLTCSRGISTVEFANDWESHELIHLLSIFTSKKCLEKCKYTLKILDVMWDDYYTSKSRGYYTFQSTDEREYFESSFIKCIHNFKWVACSIDNELYCPKDLFHDCDPVRSILGDFAPYAIPKVNSKIFLEDIGFKVHVSLDDALSVIQFLKSSKTPSTSIYQMSNFYTFISDELAMKKGDTMELGPSIPIYIPLVHATGNLDVVPGIFTSPDKVYWHDPTGCVDIMKQSVYQNISAGKAGCVPCLTLASLYPGLHHFFVNNCGVHEVPTFGRYLEILQRLSGCIKPSQVSHEVFQVFLKWADDVKCGSVDSVELLALKESLLKPECTVLPTMTDKWVSLHPQYGLICWNDDEELKDQYMQLDNVCILQFGERTCTEKEMLSSKVAAFMKMIGISSLTEVVYREAIFYGVTDSAVEVSLINWILPYAQRYVYNRHPDAYFQLKQFGFEKLTQLKIIAVEKLFYKNCLKGHHSTNEKRFECTCLLQGNIFYTTGSADSHMLFFELSRLFFNGTPELQITNFLHIIASMAESGSTKEQTESFIRNSQKVPELPASEPLWSLSDPLTLYNTQPVDTSPVVAEKHRKTFAKKPFTKSSWPPTNWKTAPDCNFSTDGHLRRVSVPNIIIEDDSKMESVLTTGVLQTAEGTDQPTSSSGPVDEGIIICSELEHAPVASFIDPDVNFDTAYSAPGFDIDKLWLDTTENQQSYKTGRLGEMIAYKYFTDKLGLKDVKWVNEESETGLPYDLILGKKGNTEYVEVKTTTSALRNWLHISANEWQCASKNGDAFILARVILSSPTSAKIIVMKNPLKLCQQKVLHMALLMPSDTESSSSGSLLHDELLFSGDLRID